MIRTSSSRSLVSGDVGHFSSSSTCLVRSTWNPARQTTYMYICRLWQNCFYRN